MESEDRISEQRVTAIQVFVAMLRQLAWMCLAPARSLYYLLFFRSAENDGGEAPAALAHV